jgi:hypothetical protein
MNIDYFFTDFTEIRTFRALTKPPLGSSIERYAEYLRVEGYSMQSAREHLRMLGRFNEWLENQGRATGFATTFGNRASCGMVTNTFYGTCSK